MANWRSLYPYASHYVELPTTTMASKVPTETSKADGECIRMHYVESGADDQGRPTILCVHGNPTWSFTFRSILDNLSDVARVIAVDHVGCGLSDKPQDYPYNLGQHTQNLVHLIDRLNLRRVVFLVHDWGGAIGLGAALARLDRVAGAVILNTAAFPPPYVPLRIAACRIPIVGNYAMRGLNLFAKAALTMTLNRLPKLAPEVADGLIAPYGNWHDRVAIARFVQDIPRQRSDSTWQVLEHLEANLPRLAGVPVQFVWGMRDWCFRLECLDRFLKHLPGSSVKKLDDVGHYVMEEASQEVIAALRCVLAKC